MPRAEVRFSTGQLTSGPFTRTTAGLLVAAFFAPFSVTHVAGSLTVGRVCVLLLAFLLAWDLVALRPSGFRPSRSAWILAAGYTGLCGWAFLSSQAIGCNCEGKAGGLFELAAIGLLALAAVTLEPRLRGPALVAAVAGLTVAAALALAGVGSINSGTVDLTDTGGRLSGLYGNANELGLAAALGLPILLAFGIEGGRRERVAAAAVALVLLVTLGLTYSRGGIVAAGAGVLAVALWEARGSRKAVALVLLAAVLVGGAGAALYSVFKEKRESASFVSVPRTLAGLSQRDASGWDSRALPPVPKGGSTLRSGRGGFTVETTGRGQGASYGLGEAGGRASYRADLEARSVGAPLRIEYALGDRLRGAPESRAAGLGSDWRRLNVRWRPGRRSPHAALSIWATSSGAGFELRDIHLETSQAGASSSIEIPTTLRGSIYDHLLSTANRSEQRYVESRLDAARLAWRAFRADPVQGIGWSEFPSYSAQHLDYGRLAAHDQYLLIAAELGLVGLAFLALLIAAPIVGVRSAPRGPATTAAIGTLVAAGAGMLFVEILAAPQLAVPIVIAAAVVSSGPGPQRLRTRSRAGNPSPTAAIALK